MKRCLHLLFFVGLVLGAPSAWSDEQIRQVQEELRKRQLYYGDIDGRTSPELASALARYQHRKGFAATGAADDPTLRSLGITAPAPAAGQLPDVPVLRSDVGPRPSDLRFISVQAGPTPAAVTRSAPAPLQDQIRELLRQYLAASETPNVADEVGFYGNEIDFFDRGHVGRAYIENELTAYDQRWPERKYTLLDPVTVRETGDKIVATCQVKFSLAAESGKKARGKTANTFVLAKRGEDGWEIVSIQEERVRQPRRSRAPARSKPRPDVLQRVGNSVKKLFGR